MFRMVIEVFFVCAILNDTVGNTIDMYLEYKITKVRDSEEI